MIEPNDLNQLNDLVQKAQDILIITHEKPTADSVGSALALYLALVNSGKRVTVACPDAMTVELSDFVAINKITSEIAKKNFIISLDYTEGSIEKVSYNIEGDTFNLVIEPRPGFETFSSDKVHYKNAGTSVDLIISVDTIHLGGLKKIFDTDSEIFTSKPIVNIDRHANNANYGTLNLINPAAGSTSEIVGKVLDSLHLPLNEDIATNLLNALIMTSNNFQSPFVTSDTFEFAASCMKAGGKRFSKKADTQPIAADVQVPEPIAEPSYQPEPRTNQFQAPAPMVQPINQNIPKKPMVKPNEAPADWLKPKIFRSTSTS